MAEVNHFYAEQTTASTFSSASPASPTNGCLIDGASLSGSTKYLIIAKAVLSGSNAGDDYACNITTSHDSNIGARSIMRIQPTYTTSGEGKGFFFVGSFTTHASVEYSVHFQVVSYDSTDGYIDQMSLLLIDLDDLGSGNYVESWNTTSDPLGTTSYADVLAELTSGNLTGSTEYLVLGYSQIDVLDNKSNMHTRLFGDSNGNGTQDQLTYASEEGEIADELRIFGYMGRVLTESTPADDIEIQAYAAAANDWTKLYAYLIAIDISAFDNFDYDFTADNTSAIGDTPAELESLSFTRSNSGNHLILGQANYESGGAEGRMALENRYDGTAVLSGDIDTYQTQAWDPTDAESGAVMARESISSNALLTLFARKHASDSVLSAEYTFQAILDLALATGVQDIAPTLQQQLATGINPDVTPGAVDISPALQQQLATGINPTDIRSTVDISPTLYQQLAAALDPTVTPGAVDIAPVLMQQLAVGIEPTVTQEVVQDIAPVLVQQLATGIDPTDVRSTVDISPTLVQQLATGIDPTVTPGAVDIAPLLVQQLATAIDPTVTPGPVDISPVLVQQLAAALDPTDVRSTVDISPALQQQLAAAFAPALGMSIKPALAQQLATGIDPVVTQEVEQDISPVLVQQLATGIDPRLGVTIKPALVQQLATGVDPTVTPGAVDVAPALTQQLAAALDPTIVPGAVDISPALVQQLAGAIDPSVGLTIKPALTQQLATGIAPAVITDQDISPSLVQQLATGIDPTVTQAGATQDITPTPVYQPTAHPAVPTAHKSPTPAPPSAAPSRPAPGPD